MDFVHALCDRNRIQNHALQDVSSKNYDRWTYMPEKREGMDKWDKFVASLLRKTRLTIAAQHRIRPRLLRKMCGS